MITWCHQATSHYLNQCSTSSVTPYGITWGQYINSLWPSDAIRHQASWSALILVMPRHLFRTKPLPEPMWTCQLYPEGWKSEKSESKYQRFFQSRPCIWKCPLYNGSHFVSARDYFVYVPNQWETMIQCNDVSHWLSAYTKRFLLSLNAFSPSYEYEIPTYYSRIWHSSVGVNLP